MNPTVGVLALQGAFGAHSTMLRDLGVSTVEVRTIEQLASVDALVLPGGESTTMSKMLVASGLFDPLNDRLRAGMPAFGTCAGMILLARDVLDGRADQRSFGVLPIAVRRNGYGRQIESFEGALDIAALGTDPFPLVFIRAPRVESVDAGVDILATFDGHPALIRSGPLLAAVFHPELTTDPRLHQYFLTLIERL